MNILFFAYLPKLTLSVHVFGLSNSTYAFCHPVEIHTDIYISREISIEQPSVTLALLAQNGVLQKEQKLYKGEIKSTGGKRV